MLGEEKIHESTKQIRVLSPKTRSIITSIEQGGGGQLHDT